MITETQRVESVQKTKLPTFNVERIRTDFPILTQRVYDRPLVYLDNAATSQKPSSVIETVADYYRTQNANVHRGVHALSELATKKFEQAREAVQRFINAQSPKEVIFVRGTTEAINLVAQSYGRTFFKAGDEIVISEMEHHANIVPWQMLREQTGVVLNILPVSDRGELMLDAYQRLLTEKTKLVSLTHVSNVLGTINPVRELVDMAHTVGAKVLIDGAQAAAHMKIDVQKLDCDFYAFSGHKVFGPTGIGVLYGKEALLERMPPYQGGGEMIRKVTFAKTEYADLPFKFEAGTPHIAGALGLQAALDYLRRFDMADIHRHESALIHYAHIRAEEYPDLKIIGTASEKASVFSFVFEGIHAHDVATILDRKGIAVRAGHHCAMPLMQRLRLAATARASFAFYNTHDEVDALFLGLAEARRLFS